MILRFYFFYANTGCLLTQWSVRGLHTPKTACAARADKPHTKPPMRSVTSTGLTSSGTIVAQKSCVQIMAISITRDQPSARQNGDVLTSGW